MIPENLVGSQEVMLKLGRFILTLAIGGFLTRAVLMPLTGRLLQKRKDEKTLHSIVNIVGIIGFFLTLTVALQAGSFGNLATIIGAIAAALTVAVGFGMREQVGNVVSGIFIYFDNPFILGDYIKNGEVEGVVKEINLRDTIINGSESEKTVIPNSQLMNSPTKNFTKGRKTKTSIGLELKPENLEEVKEILLEKAGEHEKILEKPEPEVVLKAGEKFSAELHYWVKNPGEAKKVRSQVLEEYLKEAGKKGLFEEKET
jgi:small conductance mechanosensitive channel